jgi:hypothetical protein
MISHYEGLMILSFGLKNRQSFPSASKVIHFKTIYDIKIKLFIVNLPMMLNPRDYQLPFTVNS